MISLLLVSLGGGQDFSKSFELYPPISTAPVVAQGDADSYKVKSLAKVYRGMSSSEVALDNGVVQARISLENFGKPLFFQLKSDGKQGAVIPPLKLMLNGDLFEVGGENPRWLRVGSRGQLFAKPFDVRGIMGGGFVWPPRGMGVRFMWAHRDFSGLMVEVIYQMVDREPMLNQAVTIRNGSTFPVRVGAIIQGDGLYPPEQMEGDELGWILRPNRVVDMPEAWFRMSPGGTLSGTGRTAGRVSLAPWTTVPAQELKQWPVADDALAGISIKAGGAGLIPGSAGIEWSAPQQSDYDQVQKLVEYAKKKRWIPGAVVELSGVPGGVDDRTGEGANSVCWHSFAGVHWRQNVLATWKRMGLEVIELRGELPGRCNKVGHGEHQTPEQARVENFLALRDLMRQGLSVGVIIRHQDLVAYGPTNWN